MAGQIDASLCSMCKSISMSKNPDGTISITVVGWMDNADKLCQAAMNMISSEYKIIGSSEDGGFRTIVAVSEKNKDSAVKVKNSGIFKSIPKDIYDLYASGLFYRSIVPANVSPGVGRYIKESDDIYGAQGWTVQEIFSMIGGNVSVPAGLDYHVYEANITKGAPLSSVIRSFFPLPGVTIANRNGSLYINLPGQEREPSIEGTCVEDIGVQETITKYSYKVIGLQGEFKASMNEGGSSDEIESDDTDASMKCIRNAVGGIFFVESRTVSNLASHEQYFNDYFNDQETTSSLDPD